MKKILLMGLGLLLVIGMVAAYKGDISVTGPNYSEERHTAMLDAFENNDYQAWKDLMTQDGRSPGVLRFVTEDNFAEFAETHGEGCNGECGLHGEGRQGQGKGQGARDGTGMGQGRGMHGSGQGTGGYASGTCPYLTE